MRPASLRWGSRLITFSCSLYASRAARNARPGLPSTVAMYDARRPSAAPRGVGGLSRQLARVITYCVQLPPPAEVRTKESDIGSADNPQHNLSTRRRPPRGAGILAEVHLLGRSQGDRDPIRVDGSLV